MNVLPIFIHSFITYLKSKLHYKIHIYIGENTHTQEASTDVSVNAKGILRSYKITMTAHLFRDIKTKNTIQASKILSFHCLPHGLHVSSKTTPQREPRCQLFFTQSDRSVHFQKSLSQEYNRSLGPYSWATVPIHSSTAPRSFYHVHLFVCTLSNKESICTYHYHCPTSPLY